MTTYINGAGRDLTTGYAISFWRDQITSGSSLGVGAAAPARTKLGSTSYVYYYALGVGDLLSTEVQFNHDAVQGSVTISPHVHAILPAAPSAGNKVKLAFDYTFAGIDSTFTVDPNHDFKETTLTGMAQYRHILIEFADINVTMGLSAIMMCGVARVSAAPNEYGSNIGLIGFDVHYTVNTPGSTQEYVK